MKENVEKRGEVKRKSRQKIGDFNITERYKLKMTIESKKLIKIIL